MFRSVRRTVGIYFAYFVQFLKSRMAYKWDFVAMVFAGAVVSASNILFVVILMDGKTVTALNGWTRDEVLFIYGYSMLATALFSLLSPNLYEFGDRYVIQGQFDRILLRPLQSLSQVMFESFNLESLGNIIVGVSILVYTKQNLGIQFGVWDYGWIVLSSISGGVILLSVFIFLASLSFHFEDRLGIAPPFYNLINFGRYPVTIFNRVLQFVLQWVVPFAFVAFYPATHFFNRHGFEFYCYLTPVMALITLAVAVTAWNFGVSRYSSTGSGQ